MATKEKTEPRERALEVPETKPVVDNRIGFARRLRRDVGGALEYLWELSGSIRLYKADALLVEGEERGTGLPLKAFYFGHYDNYAFLFKRLYSNFRVVKRHTGLNSARIRKWIAEYYDQASLLCLDVELLYCTMMNTGGYLEVPQWVRQKYRVPGSWDGVLKSFRKNTRKTDLRKIRKYGFRYRISRDEQDYKHFYHDMYVPYLKRRFADEVIIEPEWKVLRQCRKGELMHVLREDRVVAAVLLHLLGGRLAYVWVGVPDDLDDDLHNGAFSALYYFTILYAYLRGCHEVDFLGSRPLLNDGLFRYKRKWGTYVEDSPVPRGDILLKPLSLSQPLKSFFSSNHFVARDGCGLVGKILLEATATVDCLEELHDGLYTEGLERLEVYCMAAVSDEVTEWAQDPANPVRLIDLSGSPDPAEAFCRA